MEDNTLPTPSTPQVAVPSAPVRKCISERLFAITVIFSLLFGTASVYFWFNSLSAESRSILEQHIEDIRAQRDEVLDQRAEMKEELDAYMDYVFELTGERTLPSEEEEEEEESADEQ